MVLSGWGPFAMSQACSPLYLGHELHSVDFSSTHLSLPSSPNPTINSEYQETEGNLLEMVPQEQTGENGGCVPSTQLKLQCQIQVRTCETRVGAEGHKDSSSD